jgi:hypothetical protein
MVSKVIDVPQRCDFIDSGGGVDEGLGCIGLLSDVVDDKED